MTPNSPAPLPKAAVGNDLLLAENVGGPIAASGHYTGCTATSWSTDLQMGRPVSGDPRAGISPDGEVVKNAMWTGSGPTGVFSTGTIGVGKHTEPTLQDIKAKFAGGLACYCYVFHVTTWCQYDGKVGPRSDINSGYDFLQVQ